MCLLTEYSPAALRLGQVGLDKGRVDGGEAGVRRWQGAMAPEQSGSRSQEVMLPNHSCNNATEMKQNCNRAGGAVGGEESRAQELIRATAAPTRASSAKSASKAVKQQGTRSSRPKRTRVLQVKQ